jgi:hypothetical protein
MILTALPSLGQNAANGRFEPKLTVSISVELAVADWARLSHPAEAV